jgi:hypothetical protein
MIYTQSATIMEALEVVTTLPMLSTARQRLGSNSMIAAFQGYRPPTSCHKVHIYSFIGDAKLQVHNKRKLSENEIRGGNLL